MAVIELNLLNSQNEFSQMGEHFQDEHNLQKFSPNWRVLSHLGENLPSSACAPTVQIKFSSSDFSFQKEKKMECGSF